MLKLHLTVSARTYGLLLITAAALLGGCATNPAAISASSKLEDKQGVVTLRVVSLHERTLRQVLIENLDTAQIARLEPQPGLGGDSYRFTGIVPAGRYRTKALHGSDSQDLGYVVRTYTLNAPLDRPGNTFEVSDKRLTNLGTIVFTPMPGGSRFIAPRESTPVAAREWLEYANPGLASALDRSRELGWLEPESAEATRLGEREMHYARAHTAGTSAPWFDGKASAWAGGKLGLVVETRPDGSAARYQTGSVHQILRVAPLADGRLLAAGEEGYVAVSTPDRQSWREVPAPASKASSAVLVHQDSNGAAYLVERTPRGVAVFVANVADFAWKELRRIEREPSAASGGNWVHWASFGLPRPTAVATDARLVVSTPDPELLSSYDFATGQWESVKPATSVMTMQSSRDGVISVLNGPTSVWATSDYGRNWWKLDSYLFQTMPAFADRATGYLLAKPAPIWKVVPPSLKKTGDGGKTWVDVGSAPPDVHWGGRLLYDSAKQRIGYFHPNGKVAWTADEGRTWN